MKGAFRDKQFSQNLAIKIIDKAAGIRKFHDEERFTRYLKNEILILQKVRHKNIVHFYDHNQSAKNHYLVFECCEGGDLAKYIKDHGPLNELKAQNFFHQIA